MFSNNHMLVVKFSTQTTCCIPLWIQVNRFDMLPGIDVKWWGALSNAFDSFLGGKVISDAMLSGFYRNATVQVSFLLVKNSRN